MAVSGKTAAPHEIPYFLDGDKPPDMAAVTKAMAERTAARLDAIAPKQIVGLTKNQLLIANASGVVTAVTASGDVTNDESGVFTIGAEKVGTTKIANDAVTAVKIAENAVGASEIAASAVGESEVADGAVTSRKAKLTSGVVRSTADLLLTEAWQDITGATLKIKPLVKSKILIVTAFQFQNVGVGGSCTGSISVDGVTDEEHGSGYGWGAQTAQSNFNGLSEVYEHELTAAEHTIKLRGLCHIGEGFSEHTANKGCSFLYLLHAV